MLKKVKFTSEKQGFTLIELLVVISIIALLASVIFAGFAKARSKARDARRVSDMHQIQTALELYLDGHNGSYPATPASQKLADVSGVGPVSSSTDPLTQQSYGYIATKNVAGNNVICTTEPCMGYAIIASKENPESSNSAVAFKDGLGNIVATSTAANVVATNVTYTTVAALTGSGASSTPTTYANLSGATGSQSYFTFDVPANTGAANFKLTGGTGDADLYVKFSANPTQAVKDCYSGNIGNEELCTVGSPAAGTWHVMVYGYAAYAGVTLSVTFDPSNAGLVAGLGGALTQAALPGFKSQMWKSVACSVSICAAVGSIDTVQPIITSPDGIAAWTPRTISVAQGWHSIAYGSSKFVAVSKTGPNYSMTSPDGITWTMGSLVAGAWSRVIWSGTQFVALNESRSSNTAIATSPDGVTWTLQTTPAPDSNTWSDIAYSGSMYIVTSDAPATNGVMSSPNGITWTLRTTPGNGSLSVTYGNGLFVALGDTYNPPTALTVSSDGINWVSTSTVPNGIWNSVIYAGGQFVAVSSDSGAVITSPNGTTWTSQLTSETYNDIAYAGGKYIVVGQQNLVSDAISSSDGVTWTHRATPRSPDWRHIAKANNLYIATAWGGQIATSPDGLNWTMQASPAVQALGSMTEPDWGRAAYGNGLYVILLKSNNVNGNNLMTSPDAMTWTLRTMPSSAIGNGLDFLNGQFIAGSYGYFLTSPDGLTWSIRSTANVNYGWSSIAYGGGKYVAIAEGPNPTTQDTATSPDGITWTRQNFPVIPNSYSSSVAYNGSFFTAVGGGYPWVMSTSTDGVNWPPLTVLPSGARPPLQANGTVELLSSDGTNAAFSPNGITWASWYMSFTAYDAVLDSNGSGGYRALFLSGSSVYVSQ